MCDFNDFPKITGKIPTSNRFDCPIICISRKLKTDWPNTGKLISINHDALKYSYHVIFEKSGQEKVCFFLIRLVPEFF